MQQVGTVFFAVFRLAGVVVFRRDLLVGQIAAAIARGQDFLAHPVQSLQKGDPGVLRSAAGGAEGGGDSGGPASDDDDVFHRPRSFGCHSSGNSVQGQVWGGGAENSTR